MALPTGHRLSAPVRVTIVGAGSYGRLVAGKYRQHPGARLSAVISPTVQRADLQETPLHDVPLHRSARDWSRRYGRPTARDVFDLCIHVKEILEVVESLVAIGARSIILPKPVAVDAAVLSRLRRWSSEQGVRFLVASQWHYGRLAKEIRTWVRRVKRRHAITRIEMEFSQSFEPSRRKHYTAVSAFVPHMLQMLESTELVDLASMEFQIDHITPYRLRARGISKRPGPRVDLKTHLEEGERIQCIRVYLDHRSSPALEVDPSGIRRPPRFLEYPYLAYEGRVHPVVEDVLETMVDAQVRYFYGRGTANALTLNRYRNVANQQVRIARAAEEAVAIVGGGLFGLLVGYYLARRGVPVTVFERQQDILLGASLVNQCRVHMGYHYPRDVETARSSLKAMGAFRKFFAEAIVPDHDPRLRNHYCISREGSLTTPAQFLEFCRLLKLPYKKKWPDHVRLDRKRVALCVEVPELTFDVRVIRRHMKTLLARQRNLQVLTSTPVERLKRRGNGYELEYLIGGTRRKQTFGAVVNCTYAHLNQFARQVGVKPQAYQFELCEMPVVSTPWTHPTAVAVMDGLLPGIMPFGFSDEYLLYDTEISVLERSVGFSPRFVREITWYDAPEARRKRYRRYVEKMKRWFPEITKCRHEYSMYVTRAVLPFRDHDDARPTITSNPVPGYWQVFSGKIAMSLQVAHQLAPQVDRYLADRAR